MRIRNTKPERKPTRSLYDAETMGEYYDPPGISFSRKSHTAPVRKEVGPALADKFSHLEIVEPETDAQQSESTDETVATETDSDSTETANQ